MKWFDSHCHLHDSDYYIKDREEVYQQALAAKVAMLCVATDNTSSREALAFASQHQQVWAAVGLHPHHAQEGVSFLTDIDWQTKVLVAIGEIGLDYHYNFASPAQQQLALRQQIELAIQHKLPIIFHVREAFDDFWHIVADYDIPKAVVHSFSDNLANLERVLAKNWYIGVNGLATFSKNPDQLAAWRQIPLANLLIETDAPYLAPHPFRGRTNQPVYVIQVAEFLAKLLDCPLDDLASATYQNACCLFNLP